MDDLERDLMESAEEDIRTVAFIRNYLPQDLKDKFSDDDLFYLLDLIVEYYATSGVLDQGADENGEIDIDVDAVVAYVQEKAEKEGMGNFDKEALAWVVEGELEYGESLED